MAGQHTPVALITGANRGIGRAIADQLAQRGIRVIAACRDPAQARDTAQQLNAQGHAADWAELDVSQAQQREHAIEKVVRTHGRIDILVNNAGVALDKWVPTHDLDLELLRQTMEINLYAPLHLCQLVLPHMQAQGYGRIVNVSTELGSLTECQMGSSGAYRTPKTALNMMTRLLACEMAKQPDILINAAAPGWVKTVLGGDDAPRTTEQGAVTPVWLATLPADGPNGGFFRDQAPYPW